MRPSPEPDDRTVRAAASRRDRPRETGAPPPQSRRRIAPIHRQNTMNARIRAEEDAGARLAGARRSAFTEGRA